jgi:DNA (cytosine-5)-methyltransferase 1
MAAPTKPIAVDFFCGAGGLSLGFHRAGFSVVAAVDFDSHHTSTYSKNFPNTATICADIKDLTGSQIRKQAALKSSTQIDVVFGGPPCQGFSLIGKRVAEDPRNRLLGEYCRMVRELRPRYFVIENVAGLMYGNTRAVLAAALRDLRRAGYRWVTPIRILDAHEYGVPQRRRRVFVLGYRKGQLKPKYPKISKSRTTVKDAIGDLAVLGRCKRLHDSDEFDGKLGKPSPYAKRLRSKGKKLTGCLRVVHTRAVIKRFRNTKRGEQERVSRFVRLSPSRPAPTLRAGTAKDHGGFTAPRPIHPTQPRCITVREAARLHSFPDGFVFDPTQWHGFRQVGNSVPPLLAASVARSFSRLTPRKEVHRA